MLDAKDDEVRCLITHFKAWLRDGRRGTRPRGWKALDGRRRTMTRCCCLSSACRRRRGQGPQGLAGLVRRQLGGKSTQRKQILLGTGSRLTGPGTGCVTPEAMHGGDCFGWRQRKPAARSRESTHTIEDAHRHTEADSQTRLRLMELPILSLSVSARDFILLASLCFTTKG